MSLDLMYIKRDYQDELIILLKERNKLAEAGIESQYIKGSIHTVEHHIKMIDAILESKEISNKINELLDE
jgi:hypothetical protein